MDALRQLEIRPDQAAALAQALAAQQAQAALTWDALATELAATGAASLPLVGYGSLVNLESAALTLGPQTLATARPVVAFGVRRVFDLPLPASSKRYPPATAAKACAGLNVYFTGQLDDVVNGMRFEVAASDLAALRQREAAYDLVSVPCYDWQERPSEPFPAYVFTCPRGHPDLTPHHGYYRVCRQGAARVGPEFLALWLESTYLADNATLVRQWEKSELPELVPE